MELSSIGVHVERSERVLAGKRIADCWEISGMMISVILIYSRGICTHTRLDRSQTRLDRSQGDVRLV